MRVVVCGGRKYSNTYAVMRELDALHEQTPITELMEGGAQGADALAMHWAMSRPEIRHHQCRADWGDLSYPDAVIRTRPDGSQYDARAGHRRNAMMVAWKPDLLVAFPGGGGTADMIRQAEIAGIKIIRAGR